MLTLAIVSAAAVVGWIVREFLGHLLGQLIGELLSPLVRPLWSPVDRALRHASWPWPLYLLLTLGTAAAGTGLWLGMEGGSRWAAVIGIGMFFGGAVLTLMSPFLWRDACRARAKSYVPGKRL